jgi:hypothetical protein
MALWLQVVLICTCLVSGYKSFVCKRCILSTCIMYVYHSPRTIQNNSIVLISNINRVTHRATRGHRLIPMPDPRLIGLPMGRFHGRTSRPIPYPFGSGAHGQTYPWVEMPAWLLSLQSTAAWIKKMTTAKLFYTSIIKIKKLFNKLKKISEQESNASPTKDQSNDLPHTCTQRQRLPLLHRSTKADHMHDLYTWADTTN